MDLHTRERLLQVNGVGPGRRHLVVALRRLAHDRDQFDLTKPMARIAIRTPIEPSEAASWSALQSMAMASSAEWFIPVPLIDTRKELRRVRDILKRQQIRLGRLRRSR